MFVSRLRNKFFGLQQFVSALQKLFSDGVSSSHCQ